MPTSFNVRQPRGAARGGAHHSAEPCPRDGLGCTAARLVAMLCETLTCGWVWLVALFIVLFSLHAHGAVPADALRAVPVAQACAVVVRVTSGDDATSTTAASAARVLPALLSTSEEPSWSVVSPISSR